MKSREYFDSAAPTWDAQHAGDGAYKAIEQAVIALNIHAGDVVLDVGCGTGRTTTPLLNAVGTRGTVLGMDFSRAMLVEAHRKRLSQNASYVQADAHHIPVRSESVTAIMCFAAFPHFARKERFLEEACRVLRRGGRLAICHPMSSSELNAFHKKVGDAVKHHVLDEPAVILKMARQVGYEAKETKDVPGLYLVVLEKFQ